MKHPSLAAGIIDLIQEYINNPTEDIKQYIQITVNPPVSALWWPGSMYTLPYLHCASKTCIKCRFLNKNCVADDIVSNWRENFNLDTSKQLLSMSKDCNLVQNEYFKYAPVMSNMVMEFPLYNHYISDILIERLEAFINNPENPRQILAFFRNPCKILFPPDSTHGMEMLWKYIWEFERQNITNRIIIAAKIKGFLETGIIPISDNALLKQSFLILEEITNHRRPILFPDEE